LVTKHSEEQAKASTISVGELEEEIVKLANQGRSASEIGLILKAQHAVLSVKKLAGKRIAQIMHEKGVLQEIPEDLMNLIRTSVKLQKHMVENKKDYTAKHGYQLAVSKIRRLAKYYIASGKLPSNWRYTPETAQLLVK